MRRLLLSSACAFACLALATPAVDAADTKAARSPNAATNTPLHATPAWVSRSNEVAQPLLKVQAEFAPEFASFFGLPGYDDRVADFGPNNGERQRAAIRSAKGTLEKELKTEENPCCATALPQLSHRWSSRASATTTWCPVSNDCSPGP